jgi:hypothetical protein
MMSLDFWRSSSEHTIFVRWNGDTQLVVGVYVDDFIITSSDRDNIKSFKKEMTNTFKMSDFRLLHYYLKIEVK